MAGCFNGRTFGPPTEVSQDALVNISVGGQEAGILPRQGYNAGCDAGSKWATLSIFCRCGFF